jgi:hypothetical protein
MWKEEISVAVSSVVVMLPPGNNPNGEWNCRLPVQRGTSVPRALANR